MDIKINDWLKDDFYGYWQIVGFYGECAIVKKGFNRDRMRVNDLHFANRFAIRFVCVSKLNAGQTVYRTVTLTERNIIDTYFQENPDSKKLFECFTDRYMEYRNQLLCAGVSESDHGEGMFYRRTTEKTAFILNMTDCGTHIEAVYGFASTAFKDDKYFLEKYGVSSENCNLRRATEIHDEESSAAAMRKIKEFYNLFNKVDKDCLLEVVKQKRKEFINKIHLRLKPLGFRKSGNKWLRLIENDVFLKVAAIKYLYSDEYCIGVEIFRDNEYMRKNGYIFWCVDKIVKIEGREIIDWQLMPWEKVDEALAGEIKEGLIYAVLSAASLSELRKNKEIQWRCRCDRSKCPQCWLEYTFYQQNDTP